MSTIHPECTNSGLSDRSIAAGILLRQEPDEEEDDDEEDEDEDKEDDDDNHEDDGYSE